MREKNVFGILNSLWGNRQFDLCGKGAGISNICQSQGHSSQLYDRIPILHIRTESQRNRALAIAHSG